MTGRDLAQSSSGHQPALQGAPLWFRVLVHGKLQSAAAGNWPLLLGPWVSVAPMRDLGADNMGRIERITRPLVQVGSALEASALCAAGVRFLRSRVRPGPGHLQ